MNILLFIVTTNEVWDLEGRIVFLLDLFDTIKLIWDKISVYLTILESKKPKLTYWNLLAFSFFFQNTKMGF